MLVVLSPGYLLSDYTISALQRRAGLPRHLYRVFRQSGVLVRLYLLGRSLVGPAMAAEACCANRCLTRLGGFPLPYARTFHTPPPRERGAPPPPPDTQPAPP